MAYNFIDRYSSLLSSPYTAGGTTLNVLSAANLPTGACTFYVVVQAESTNTEEVFKVTNVSGTALTVVGAQANTAAQNHSSGAVIIGSVMTAAMFANLFSSINGVGPYASLPSSGSIVGQMYECTDSLFSYTWTGTAWQAFFRGFPCTPPVTASFSWQNQSTAVLVNTRGGEIIQSAIGGASAHNVNGRYTSYPAAPFTRTLGMRTKSYGTTLLNGNAGLYISDGTKVVIFTLYYGSKLGLQSGPTLTNISTNVVSPTAIHPSDEIFLRFDDGVTSAGKRTYYYSYDNYVFYQFYQEVNTTTLTATSIGYYADAYESGTYVNIWAFHWA
jgi:hypothetical protein